MLQSPEFRMQMYTPTLIHLRKCFYMHLHRMFQNANYPILDFFFYIYFYLIITKWFIMTTFALFDFINSLKSLNHVINNGLNIYIPNLSKSACTNTVRKAFRSISSFLVSRRNFLSITR